MTDLSYTNKDGDSVHTAQYLKNRGSCCKSTCLHCPYGFTLEQFSLQFKALDKNDIRMANQIINGGEEQEEFDIVESLLASAFGNPQKLKKISSYNMDQYRLVILKNEICGLIKMGKLQISELFLKTHFDNQNLTLEEINNLIDKQSNTEAKPNS
jgi:hypothetical protein